MDRGGVSFRSKETAIEGFHFVMLHLRNALGSKNASRDILVPITHEPSCTMSFSPCRSIEEYWNEGGLAIGEEERG